MSLQLLAETEISADQEGTVVYIGNWDEALAILSGFKISQTDGAYSFVAFQPTVLLSAAPTAYTSETATEESTDWSADIATLKAANKLVVTNARLRCTSGGMGRLSITLGSPDDLRNKIREAAETSTQTTGEVNYSFGVTEVPHSILEAETTTTQEHIAAWLSAPSVLKSRFLYVNAETGENATLLGNEITLATKILTGQDTYYVYLPSVTLTISKAASAPSGLPTIGATTGPSTSTININLPATGYSWRIINSGSWQNSDGTWSGTVQWISEESEEA